MTYTGVRRPAALGITAILEDLDEFAGRYVVTLVCGSNMDLDIYDVGSGRPPYTGLDSRSGQPGDRAEEACLAGRRSLIYINNWYVGHFRTAASGHMAPRS
jgi:hypothetical protein